MTEAEHEKNGEEKRFFPARAGTVNFEVWGMPTEKYKEFLSFTREVAMGKMAVAIMTLMELAKTYDRYAELSARIDQLEAKANVKEIPKPKTMAEARALAQERGVEDGKTGSVVG